MERLVTILVNVGKAAGKTSKASKEMAADEAKETVKESTQQAKEARLKRQNRLKVHTTPLPIRSIKRANPLQKTS